MWNRSILSGTDNSRLTVQFIANDRRSVKLNEHVFRKFPDRISDIKALADKNPTFRTILADYAEMCTWLETLERSAQSDPGESAHARELIQNLEEEIFNQLKKHEAAK